MVWDLGGTLSLFYMLYDDWSDGKTVCKWYVAVEDFGYHCLSWSGKVGKKVDSSYSDVSFKIYWI